MTLGACLGYGRSCVVFEATVDLSRSSSELRSFVFPPLVVKVSRPRMAEDLQHEAFYYDEMECVQGVIVPRYYGTFKGRLPAGFSTPPDDCAHGRGVSDDEAYVPAPVFDFSSVCVSVMERLSDHLPIGEPFSDDILYGPFPVYTHLSADCSCTPGVLEVFKHLAKLGIEYDDIRHANILRIPESPESWPCHV